MENTCTQKRRLEDSLEGGQGPTRTVEPWSSSKIIIAKAAFNKKNTLFTRKLDLNLRKKLIKCYIWSMALYGTKTWTHLKVDEKYRVSSEIWCWRMMKKLSCVDCVRSEEQLQ